MRYAFCLVITICMYCTGCQNNTAAKKADILRTQPNKEQAIKPKFAKGENITDYDGNLYATIIIGKQVWMAANLNVTHYNNGDPVANVKDGKQWRQLSAGAYCNYDNKETNGKLYGKLYNWHAITDSRKLAPKGWHVPSEQEWEELIAFLGGESIAGSKLTATGTSYWEAPNNTATNQSGFTALPAGNRNNNGVFDNKGFSTTWWTSTTEAQVDFATNFNIISNSMSIKQDTDDRLCGLSLRCIRDY